MDQLAQSFLTTLIGGILAIVIVGLLARYQSRHRSGLTRPLGRPKSIKLRWLGLPSDAFERAASALASLNAEIVDSDAGSGKIAAATKYDGTTTPVSIIVSIQSIERDVMVIAEAWPTVGLFDFGASRRLLQKFAGALEGIPSATTG